jgi:DNA-binding LytR/AlgR family response regulator
MAAKHLLPALVVEDEWVARDYLTRLINASGLAHVVGAVESVDDAEPFLTQRSGLPLVVFVDISLVGSTRDGLDLLRAHAGDTSSSFVLATALQSHTLEAFALGAVDYLLKPFSEERLRNCLTRVGARMLASALATCAPTAPAALPATRIVARNKRNLVFLDLDEVWAFESADRLTVVHSARGALDLDVSLVSLEQAFGDHLLRVHRRWLVHVRYIQELERDDGDSALLVGAIDGPRLRVPIARERVLALRTSLVDEALGLRRR